MSTTDLTSLLAVVTKRLFIALVMLFVLALLIGFALPHTLYAVPAVVTVSGFIGGFVGLQRRLKDLTPDDLALIAKSWIYTCLSPFVGGVLAFLLYVLFLSGLLSGALFPNFVPDASGAVVPGFASLLQQHGADYKDYAKLIFWCFVAGFSERFVTDIISRFEGAAVKSLPSNTTAPKQP